MVHFRSPSWLIPAASHDGFSTDVHHHGSFTTAARGGLTPAPVCRCRRTYLHLHNSKTIVSFRLLHQNLTIIVRTHKCHGGIGERNVEGRAGPPESIRDPPSSYG